MGVADLREGCLDLRSMDLFGCSEVTDHALALLITECKNLQPENLHSASKGDLYCDAVAQECKNLTVIDLHDSPFVTDNGLAVLMENFPGLIEVNLEGCSQVSALCYSIYVWTTVSKHRLFISIFHNNPNALF